VERKTGRDFARPERQENRPLHDRYFTVALPNIIENVHRSPLWALQGSEVESLRGPAAVSEDEGSDTTGRKIGKVARRMNREPEDLTE
jgi:hypothetical protein